MSQDGGEEPHQRRTRGVISTWTTSPSCREAHIVVDWPATPPPPPSDGPDRRPHDQPRRVRLLRPAH